MRIRIRLALAAAGLAAVLVPVPARGQSSQPAAQDAPEARRIVWTVIGGGVGLGAGLLAGVALFDDAIHSDRKVWTTAVVGAVGGAVAGNLLSRSGTPGGTGGGGARDPLWNGMAVGAAAGALAGMWYVPKANCKTDINPECPRLLRIGVGIPMVAGGAALGALADRLIGGSSPGPRPDRSSTVVSPVFGAGRIGFVVARTF